MLFINVKGSGMTMVASSSVTTFHNDAFDKDGKALRWSSQYSDRDNKRAEFIINHCAAGSPVVVAVRRNATGSFSMLGKATRMVMQKEAHLMLTVGEQLLELLDDDKTPLDKVHRAIAPGCMVFPRSVTIRTIKATEELLTSRRVCLRCCCVPAAVDVTFDDLKEDGLQMFEDEEAEKSRKLVKKKPAKPEKAKPLARVSANALKAQKKADLAAKRAAKAAHKSENSTPNGLARDHTLADDFLDNMGDDMDDMPLGKLVPTMDDAASSGATAKGADASLDKDVTGKKKKNVMLEKRHAQVERIRVADYHKKMQSKAKDAVPVKSPPNNDEKLVPRRRLRGRTALLPSEVESLPPLSEGIIDALDGLLNGAGASSSHTMAPREPNALTTKTLPIATPAATTVTVPAPAGRRSSAAIDLCDDDITIPVRSPQSTDVKETEEFLDLLDQEADVLERQERATGEVATEGKAEEKVTSTTAEEKVSPKPDADAGGESKTAAKVPKEGASKKVENILDLLEDSATEKDEAKDTALENGHVEDSKKRALVAAAKGTNSRKKAKSD
eukprot:GEMP01013098.1.p1 GENE.GEMP01013098.1~~GEMP01013098.1.p1  ORF type:complete len:623 (+),score=145.16 GEMP01013098.1:196-1869(+)